MLNYCKLVRALAAILLANCAASQELNLNSTLYSTIYGAFVAFSNQNVSFTCTARGSNSNIMGWSSEQYIATGGRRLEFISAESPGTTRTSGDTLATLIDATVDQFIISRLYIVIQSSIPIAMVQCQNTATSTSITFSLPENDTSVICDKQSVCPGEAVTCICAVGSSNSIAWLTDGRRLLFTSNDPLLTRQDVSRSSAILTDRFNGSGIQVITSNLTLTASTEDTILLARCENVDRSTSNVVLVPISQNCPDPNEATTLPGTEPTRSTAGTSNSSAGAVAAAAVFAILFAGGVVLLVLAVLFALKEWKDIKGKEQDLQEKEKSKNAIISTLEGDKEDMKREIAEKNDTISTLEDKNKKLDNETKELREENNKMNDKNNKLKNKIQRLSSDLEAKERDLQKKERDLQKKENDLRKKDSDILKKDSDLQKKEEEIKQLKRMVPPQAGNASISGFQGSGTAPGFHQVLPDYGHQHYGSSNSHVHNNYRHQ